MAATASSAPSAIARRAGYIRWIVCGLLFFAATINYIDRQVISILKETLQEQFHWTEIDYSNIVFTFQLAYAVGFVFAGRIVDRVGTKVGFVIAILLWTVAAIGHAAATTIGQAAVHVLNFAGLGYSTSVAGFMAMRLLLGLGESGNFPAAIKTVAEWFPRRERALATGIFNSGTNIGALITPLVVPWITITYGWALGVHLDRASRVRLAAWRGWCSTPPPETHPTVGAAELAYIRSDRADTITAVDCPGARVIRHRQAWAFAVGKFLTDPVWWLYLFWIPGLLRQELRPGSEDHRSAGDSRLPARRRRQHRRRLDFVTL